MPESYSEDLFEDTKMTIGEHLDELRQALIRSVIALLVGFLIAIYFAKPAIKIIQTPLRGALERYYMSQEIERLAGELALEAGREEITDEDRTAAEEIVAGSRIVSELVLFDRVELLRMLGIDPPPDAASDETQLRSQRLKPVRIYRHIDKSPHVRIVGLSTQEPFFVYVKVSLVLGFVLASPFIFYFIWAFVAAGLYPHEKGFVHAFLPFSLILFLGGAAFAFLIVLNYVLDWLFWFNEITEISPEPRMNEWLGFVLILPVGFGLSFQLPLVMLFLERIGVMTVASYLVKWRFAVMVISLISMFLTPADPTSMVLMAVPLVGLYFGGILLCRLLPRRKTPFGETIE